MNCTEARAALLTAEPEELRGVGETELARHLRECAQCSQVASLMLDANALLANQLTRQARKRDPLTGARPKATWPKETWPVWLPLPIAAAIAALLVMQATPDVIIPRVGNLADVKHPVVVTVVNTGTSGDVAVFRAAGNVTVVWQLKAGRGS